MAVVAEEKKDENQQTQAPAPVTGGAGPAVQQGGGRLASYSTGSQPSQGSGRFTNLKSYIDANKGAGEQLGSKIGSGLEKEVKKAGDTTQAQNIGQQVQAEKDRLAQGQQFKTQLGTQTGAQDIVANQPAAQQFSNLINNQNVASNLAQQAQQAQTQQNIGLQKSQQNVEQLGTEAGRFNLLKGAVKNPNYTSGQQRLDQLFLQAGNPQQLAEKQRALTGQIGQTSKSLENMYGQLGTDIAGAGQQAEDVSQMLRGELGTQTTALSEAQRAEAEQLNKENVTRNAALETFFKSGMGSIQDPAQKAFIQNMLETGGLQAGQRTYNVLKDPNAYQQYITQGGVGYTGKDVLDANELAKYNALYQLGGATGDKMFTEAGSGGVQSTMKGQELANAIKQARSGLEQQLNRQDVGGTGNIQYQANLLDLLKYQEGGASGATPLTGSNISTGQNIGFENRGTAGTFDAPNLYARYSGAQEGKGYLLSPYQQALQDMVARYQTELSNAGYQNVLGGMSPGPTNTFNVK